MFDVPVDCKYIKKADDILKSSEDVQSSCDTLFVIYRNQRRLSSLLSISMFILMYYSYIRVFLLREQNFYLKGVQLMGL